MSFTKFEFKIVDPIENFDEAEPLLKANWRESGVDMEFIPEHAKLFYSRLADFGILFAVGAYKDGELIGYCISTIVPHPLNHKARICNADGMYLAPEYRKGLVVAEMMRLTETIARNHEASAIQWHAPAGSSFSEALAARYKPLSNYFRQDLKYDY